jgi:uncharacterized membrane-anchored protein YhcB (DUF1043 family)
VSKETLLEDSQNKLDILENELQNQRKLTEHLTTCKDKILYENEKKTSLSSVVIASKNEEVNDAEEVKSKIVINGYINFCKKNRTRVNELNKDLSPKEITKKLLPNTFEIA